MPNSSTEETIAELLGRSTRLRKLAEDLAAECGIDLKSIDDYAPDSYIPNGQRSSFDSVLRPRRKPKAAKKLKKHPTGRQQQLISYLEKNGPTTRKKLLLEAKIPKGTLGVLLMKNCERHPDGTYTWKKETE